jgi:hypothetical protein
MIIKYIDPTTNRTIIQTFSDVYLEKDSDSSHKYDMSFICDSSLFCIVHAKVSSGTLAQEYLNTIYTDEKIDFSSDANVLIEIENFSESGVFDDFMKSMLDDFCDEDADFDDDFEEDS